MQIDPLGLRFVADTNGLTEEQRQSFITELARLRKTASGCQLYNYLHSSDKVITLKFQKMEGFDGKADVRNNGGSITFSPGVSYDNIGHEFQHAAEGLSGKPDPMGFGDIVRPADEKEFPGDTSTPTECRAVRVQNRVLGEGGGSPRRYYGKTEIPYPLGTRGPKTLPAGLK